MMSDELAAMRKQVANRVAILAMVCVMVGTLFGLWLGTQEERRIQKNACEQAVVTAIMEGRPFMFVNGRAVVVMSTHRPARGTRYRATMAENEGRISYVLPAR